MRTTMMGILALGLLTGGAQADDRALRDALARRLAEGIRVEVTDGVVTLEGTARSVWDKRDAIERATETDGVAAVEDKIEIAHGESDEQVAEEIAKAVRRYVFFTIYDDVSVAIDEGNVSLTGRVTMPFKSDEIEERVSKVMGVQSVTNEITTLPTNIGDQKLRAALAYRIYRDPLFRDLASRVNPPIHIVVERGRVALTGAVRSEVEKRKAEHIARSTFGVFGVDNRLVVGS
ncbi:MAG TPA: BON domain-containing protein [Vicinamibacteria bacterium]|nr:BON domain-containing protein [Vicinamibacteria bacterium]